MSRVIIVPVKPRGGALTLKKVGRALGKVNKFARKSQIISKGLSAAALIQPELAPALAPYIAGSKMLGYGKRRGRPKGSKNKPKSASKAPAVKRGRGRPKGSKNRPKTSKN
jgi:hypothetical protein